MTKPEPQDYEAAFAFLKDYCKKKVKFNGGDVLEAFRKWGHKAGKRDWRNVWSKVLAHGVRENWMVKVGRGKPTSPQSHTRTLTIYESRLAKKPLGYKPSSNAVSIRIGELVSKQRMGEIDVMTVAWSAYSLGAEGA